MKVSFELQTVWVRFIGSHRRVRQNKSFKSVIMIWTVLKTELEYQSALNRLDKIFDSKPKDQEFKEAELLVMLIEKYETETEEAFPSPDPIEVIKFRMEQNNLRSKDLAEIVGSKSKASELLNKKRRLTLTMIRKINRALGIPAELLIGEYELVIE